MSCRNSLRSGGRLCAALGLPALLWLAPAPLHAQDRLQFVPAFNLTQEYETNPLGSEGGPRKIDDFVTRVAPSLALVQSGTTGGARLSVGANARFHRELSDLDTIDPFARFKATRDLTPRLQFLSNGAYVVAKSTDPVDISSFTSQTGRPDVNRWDATGGFAYALTPRSNMRLSYTRSGADFEPTDDSGRVQRDLDTGTLSLVFSRTLTARDGLTTSLSWSQTDFADTEALVGVPGREKQEDEQLSWTTSWRHLLTPSMTLSLTGGVRSLKSKGAGFTNAILFLPGGGTTNLPLDQSSSLFNGGASLSRVQKRGSWSLSFNQSTQAASGTSGSIDAQTFRFSLARRLSERATLKINGALSLQTSANENVGLGVPVAYNPTTGQVFCLAGELPGFRFDPGLPRTPVCAREVDSATDNRIVTASAEFNWRVSKRFTTFMGYDYLDRESSGVIGGSYDSHTVKVGIRYKHDFDVP